jgi:hypothetical protein
MTAALRWTGLGKLISFYRYFYFNGPKATTASGMLLVLGVGAIHLYLLVSNQALGRRFASPVYLDAYYGLLFASAVAAAVGMVVARRLGWALGSLVSAAAIMMYVASRVWGLPALHMLEGWWNYPLGTFMMALGAMYLGLHFSVITGVNIAHPDRRDWHD